MSTPLAPAVPGRLSVGSLAQANKHKRRFDAILTLQDPGSPMSKRLVFTRGAPPPRLVLEFEDFDYADRGVMVATFEQVHELLAFARQHESAALLVHCYHGVGRSAAAALAVLADRAGAGNEDMAVAELFALRPEATPNLVVTALADDVLGRQGALVAALSAWKQVRPQSRAQRARRLTFYEQNPGLFAHNKA